MTKTTFDSLQVTIYTKKNLKHYNNNIIWTHLMKTTGNIIAILITLTFSAALQGAALQKEQEERLKVVGPCSVMAQRCTPEQAQTQKEFQQLFQDFILLGRLPKEPAFIAHSYVPELPLALSRYITYESAQGDLVVTTDKKRPYNCDNNLLQRLRVPSTMDKTLHVTPTSDCPYTELYANAQKDTRFLASVWAFRFKKELAELGGEEKYAEAMNKETEESLSKARKLFNENFDVDNKPYDWHPHDKHLLATGDNNGQVYTWDCTTPHAQPMPAQHDKRITYLAWSPDGGHLASVCDGGTVQICGIDQPFTFKLPFHSPARTVRWVKCFTNPDNETVPSNAFFVDLEDDTTHVCQPQWSPVTLCAALSQLASHPACKRMFPQPEPPQLPQLPVHSPAAAAAAACATHLAVKK
jgi:hypothetical protein